MLKLIAGLLSIALPCSATTEFTDIYDELTQSDADVWVLDWENDYFTASDRFYTNGIRFTSSYFGDAHVAFNGELIISISDDGELKIHDNGQNFRVEQSKNPLCNKEPETAYHFHYKSELGCFTDDLSVDVYRHHAGWYAANLIYTPKDITAKVDEFTALDRPFAGYTYYGRFIETIYADDTATRYDIQLGLIGRASLSQEVQRYWHQLIDDDDPTWDQQIANEPTIQINAYHRFAIPSFLKWEKDRAANIRYLDIQPYVFGEVGSVFIRATAGVDIRIGLVNMEGYFSGPQFIPDIPKAVEPGTPTSARDTARTCIFKYLCMPVSAYLYGKYEETAVFHNATVEGGIFSDSSYTQNAERRVRTSAIGVKAVWKSFWLSMVYKSRSPEIAGIPFQDDYHRWGELQIGIIL